MADFPEILAHNYSELVDALTRVKNFRELSNETVDAIAGLTRGHCGKMLGPSREKSIGKNSLALLLGALGVRLRLEPDPDQEKLMASRWERRNSSQVRVHTHDMSSAQIECAKSIIFKQIADRLSLGRQNIPPAERSRIARRAIRARWKKGRRNGHNGHAAER